MRTSSRHRSRHRCERRKGGAVVELAICLPLLVSLVMASIECCNVLFLKQTLHIAAYEAARTATLPGGTVSAAEDRARSILDQRSIQSYDIAFTPTDLTTTNKGDYIDVTVTANIAQNTSIIGWVFTSVTMSSSVTMTQT